MPDSLRKYLFDLSTFPGDVARSWRTDGLPGMRAEVRRRSLDRIVLRARNLVIEGDLVDVRLVQPPSGVEIREFTGDWAVLGDLVGRRQAPQLSAARAAGRQCLVAWRGSEAVGYAWLAYEMDLRFDKFALPLPVDAAYLWMVRVVKAERRQGLGPALGSAALRLARDQGRRRSWMIIRPENSASLHAVPALNPSSRIVGSVIWTKLLRWTKSRYAELPQPLPVAPAPRRALAAQPVLAEVALTTHQGETR